MTLTTVDTVPALIVVDVQKGIAGAGDELSAAVVANSAALAARFRERGLPVVLVNVSGGAPGRTDATRESGPVQRPEGWDILMPELGRADDDILITKTHWGAFHGTGLDAALRERGVTQVFVTGIATSIGVESTARGAHERDYNVVLVADAMRDLTPVNHDHAIANLFPRLGEVSTTAEVLERLG